jgi:hypothetical protein
MDMTEVGEYYIDRWADMGVLHRQGGQCGEYYIYGWADIRDIK